MLITSDKYDAVLFDMDGVLTMTMKIHATCWKRMFDAYLRDREERFNEPFHPFEISSDYKAYVDGRLRYDGVQAFLLSRKILLPYGEPGDDPVRETICGLGNRKDIMVNQLIDEEGVEILQGSLQVVEMVRQEGLKTAVVSASKNCEKILDAAAIKGHFDVMIDGHVAAELELPGKPAPDTYLRASRELGVEPERAVVVEDAVSGVAAGKAGGFGLVIGIDHHGDKGVLESHGADIVVEDLLEIVSLSSTDLT